MVLDGGLATELERRGLDLDPELWSAAALIEAPESIRRLHLDYLRAGADCVVTASYQATFEGFARRGLSGDEAAALLRRSVELAVEAREAFWAEPVNRRGRLRPLVAASVGPYGAYLADGSEYRGEYALGEDELVAFHRRRFEVLAASGADLLACETLPSAVEARALARLLEATPGSPGWMSFSCRDGRHLADGSEIAEVAAGLARLPNLAAVGVNCTAPRHVPELVRALREVARVPIVVYPNTGEAWDAAARRWLPAEAPVDFAAAAGEWRALGAQLIGGCCRTGPDHVRVLRAALIGSVREPG